MSRKKVEVNKQELQAQIDALEASQTFSGYSTLFKALAATEWAVKNKYGVSVLSSRTQELGIVCKTPKGKPGRKAATSETNS